ncbi:complement factor D-like protein [Labeo rohita]|uniref:trypsin n=1 Tax=Labeo rohita TaxID=84645 RepID=A0A498MUG8_LABRO|nr:complement factor D-like protein [Labeo rohita]RXN24211.1 complement factor D-like protein [Labeo rohita]
MIIISLLLLTSLLPHLTFTDHVNVGIVNGREAKPHSRPYMVSLQKNLIHACGGFLISNRFVMTAAHCQKEDEILTAVVGAHNLKKENEGSVRIGVTSYHKHPGYKKGSKLNDIMLLRKKMTYDPISRSAHVDVGIVNGTEAKPHSRPYMVSLQKGCKHVCGGFLISDSFVMTAAHCKKYGNVTAVVGIHDLKKRRRGSDRIRVKSYHEHPDFNYNISNDFQNDIMLLKLEKEVKQNKNVKIISIPTQEGDIKPDSACSVAGWGRLSIEGKNSTRLMEADVKIMNNTECMNKWKDKYSVSQMMCVYGHGGSCKGDSGGPLVCGDIAVGITSFGGGKECNSQEEKNDHDLKLQALLEHYSEVKPQLTLQKKVKENNKVKIIKIQTQEGDIKADSACSVAGWGSLRINGSANNRLMETKVFIMDNTECKIRWGEIYKVPKMMCTYGIGGFCDGDSGGPLVYGDTAVGVVSFYLLNRCNSPVYPNVYTKISPYLEWIRKIIKNVK